MKNKNVLKNRVMLLGILLLVIIAIQTQSEIDQVNASSSTMRQLKLHITKVTHSGGHYGSYGFTIGAYCSWRRVYNNYLGRWYDDPSYHDAHYPEWYTTGTASCDAATIYYTEYSDYCYGEYLKIEFMVWKRGIIFGFLTDEGMESMGTRYYSVEATEQSISFEDGSFHVTVYYHVWD